MAKLGSAVKSAWKKYNLANGYVSLKRFVNMAIEGGKSNLSDWFDHKAGILNKKRSATNVARVAQEKQAGKTKKSK